MTEEDFYHVAMGEENIMSMCACRICVLELLTHSVIKNKNFLILLSVTLISILYKNIYKHNNIQYISHFQFLLKLLFFVYLMVTFGGNKWGSMTLLGTLP